MAVLIAKPRTWANVNFVIMDQTKWNKWQMMGEDPTYLSPFSLPLLCFILIHIIFFHFLQPKSLPSHWLFFSMSCLVPWIFDTCWRSKRGLLSSSSYLRDLSLPFSSPFIMVLLCYSFLTILFSSSLIIIVTSLHWCGYWRTCSN
jgi:hypothetical protein